MSEFEASADIKYTANVDLANKNNSHTMTYEMVQSLGRQGLSILEVGCSSGYLGQALKAVGHRVSGVEMNQAAAAQAGAVLDSIYCGTVQEFFAQHPVSTYDVIMYADVLEHIADPVDVLNLTKQHLNANGQLVVSVPNVAHIGVRWMLARGQWEYEDLGIMDRTHLRFFTKSSLIDLMSASGFTIKALHRTMMPEQVYLERYGLSNQSADYQAFRNLVADDACEDFQYIIMASTSTPQQTDAQNALWKDRALHEHFPTLQSADVRKNLASRWKILRKQWRLLWQALLVEANLKKKPVTDASKISFAQKWRAFRLLRKLGR